MQADLFLVGDDVIFIVDMAVQGADDVHLVVVQHPQQPFCIGIVNLHGHTGVGFPEGGKIIRNQGCTERIRHADANLTGDLPFSPGSQGHLL